MQFELTKEFVASIEQAILDKQDSAIISTFEDMYSEDIIPIMYELTNEERLYILNLLDKETTARIFSNLDEDTLKELLSKFSAREIAAILNELYSDDVADILNEQPVQKREEIIAYLEDEDLRTHVNELLRYDNDCAGGLMAKELIKANVNWSIKQCIEEIRRQAEDVEKMYSVYVVDNEDVLLGRVSLKKIILTSDRTKISDIYEPDIVAVETYMDAQEVGEIMHKYDLESVPVINVQQKLVGRITIDDVLDVIKEQAEQDIQAMAGISGDTEEDDTVWESSKARLPWLIIGVLGGLMGAVLMGFFEKDLILIPALAFFIPLITATGGNVGVQSSSIIVQSLANNVGIQNDYGKRLFKVILVGIANATIICSIVLGFILLKGDPVKLAMVVSVALFFVIILASIMGTITPLILDHYGINPAFASGPFITTTNDLLGQAVYFGIANLLYHIT